MFVLGDILGQVIFPAGSARICVLLSAPFAGLLLGAVTAGIIERNYRQSYLAHKQVYGRP